MTPSETIEELQDALGRGDIEAAVALLHPAVRWVQQAGFPGGTEHRGRPAVESQVFRASHAQWARFQVRTDSIHESGELVFARGAYTVSAHGVARELSVPFVDVYEVRGGLIEACHQLTDTAVLRAVLSGQL